MIFIKPDIQMGPLTGSLWMLFLILVAIGALGTVTMPGLIVWVLAAFILVAALWIIGRRILGWGAGRRM
ncbi:hypothetical protein AArcSl_1654 [Halalkaliarchaeum desulfuricum]|uniref:DUF4175 domain-containing protein n=1 Tax=Halalkaliarchaeum desulfuricum TaxID=2055893 RepID=A0A343TJL1_9EURY|nr:hypothetical protein [Halalkaliarchaeum desulfuricum]AUX09283.1 hypothetical protein AArcSl_1654 [Halalkaliarchaeum desulfuricum]